MNNDVLHIPYADLRKLLAAANPDAALVYLYLRGGGAQDGAEAALRLPQTRISCALAALRQLGLIQPEHKGPTFSGERPSYTERDVLQAEHDADFRSLYGEVQRLLGRSLNTEELKILLGFVRYLGLPVEVISMLVCYCKERARQRGSLRNPSLRSIEKEAYAWAERGIDSMEEAAAYIQQANVRSSRIGQLKKTLQIYGRNLTPGEEKYASGWLEMGFDDEAVAMAYERTCLNTGGLSWAYMNKILCRWHEAGLTTAAQIRSGDRRPGPVPKGASGELGAAELEAIQKVLKGE
jgi:DnaD/phage-associated family protein